MTYLKALCVGAEILRGTSIFANRPSTSPRQRSPAWADSRAPSAQPADVFVAPKRGPNQSAWKNGSPDQSSLPIVKS